MPVVTQIFMKHKPSKSFIIILTITIILTIPILYYLIKPHWRYYSQHKNDCRNSSECKDGKRCLYYGFFILNADEVTKVVGQCIGEAESKKPLSCWIEVKNGEIRSSNDYWCNVDL